MRVLLREVPKLDEIKEELVTFDKKQDQLTFQLLELEKKLENKEQPELASLIEEIEQLTISIQTKEANYYQQQEKFKRMKRSKSKSKN